MQPPANDSLPPDAGTTAGTPADRNADACGIAAMIGQRKPARPPAPSRATPVDGTAGLVEMVDRQIARSRRQNQPFALLCLVVDQIDGAGGPGPVEQTRRVLADCANRLCGHVRATDQVARYGLHHFGVLLPDADDGAAWSVALRLLTAGAGTYRVDDELLELRLRAGHAVFPGAGRDGAALVHAAHMTTLAPGRRADRRHSPTAVSEPAEASQDRPGLAPTEPAAYPQQPLDWGPWWR
ncbi:MAG TPA: diguanylate cyclase [Aquabacterium sp.]|nr:diguanylate cyclase [Aquabacterium sp.]